MKIILRNISLPFDEPEEEAAEIARRRLVSALPSWDGTVVLSRRSLDARRKDKISFVYSFTASVDDSAAFPEETLRKLDAAFEKVSDPGLNAAVGATPLAARPVIAGFGPCGMFAALTLARRGYRPLVVERGGDAAERAAAVARFISTGMLDTETNVQFGAGGAGTFSDGKLVTRINDPLCRAVLETFAAFGAPPSVLTEAHPHIGTDFLLGIVRNIDAEIRRYGGEILYNTRLDGIHTDGGNITSVFAAHGAERRELPCGVLLCAVGHSARDTFSMLKSSGVAAVPKPFSVGVRIEHLQEDIDRAMYGKAAGHPALPAAEYAFSLRRGEEAVYTFCMCPGGEVVAAASEEGGVVTNGMSRSARDGVNANAAIAVSVAPDDPVAFQRALERAAYAAGGGGYAAPAQTVGSFLGGGGNSASRVSPTYMGGRVTMCDLHSVLPSPVTSMLERGIRAFGQKCRGFDAPDALLTGVETRTSSPLRLPRGTDMTADGFDNLYPCGEGAGYAGGITSAAVDGIRTALAVIARYSPRADV